MLKLRLTLVSTAALLLAACGGNTVPDPDPTYDTVADGAGSNASSSGFEDDGFGVGLWSGGVAGCYAISVRAPPSASACLRAPLRLWLTWCMP